MGAVWRCTAVATNAHGSSAAGEHALYAEAGPGTDAVAIRTEVPVPAVIDGEKQLCGVRNIHAGEYKTGLRAGKPSEPRSGDARPARALRSDDLFYNSQVIRELDVFKDLADIIICNRISAELSDVMHKVYTRDLFGYD